MSAPARKCHHVSFCIGDSAEASAIAENSSTMSSRSCVARSPIAVTVVDTDLARLIQK